MKTKGVLTVAVIFVLLLYNPCLGQEKKDTLKILFVGNSYTYSSNLPQIVSLISDSTNTKLLTNKSTAPGANLSEHWNGKKDLNTKEIIKNGNFDIVVLQEQSMIPIFMPDSAYKYMKLFCDFIKVNDARPYLFLTWAREKIPQHQEIINETYLKAANENNVTIVPVGKGWALARQLRPDIKLYSGDGSHPSQLGIFLTAYIFVGSILHEIPEYLQEEYTTIDGEGESIQLMYIDWQDIFFCREIVKEIATTNK